MIIGPRITPLRHYKCTKCTKEIDTVRMPAQREPEPCEAPGSDGKHDWVWIKPN